MQVETNSLEEWQEGKIILLDKPLGWTSFDVVNKIRWKIKREFGIKKIKVGHAGTLDPKATGLLIVCTGKATKQIESIQNKTKKYKGIIKLGYTTVSYDSETVELKKSPIDHITADDIRKTPLKFIGEIDQVPPIFSALKKNGKKLYEYARKGKKIEISPRKVFIYSFDILSITMPYIEFEVVCAKGTYIRSLANDFGELLDCGGYLSSLRRENIGDYSVADAQFIS